MKWLLLLMLSVAYVTENVAKEDVKALAERIVETEGECDGLRTLERKNPIYGTLRKICEESLNDDKYAYFALSKINLAKYDGQSKVPVKINQVEEWVKKPPVITGKEMKEKLKGLNNKKNILNNKTNKRGQAIIYKQTKCELNGDENCFRELNCLKFKLMDDLKLELKRHKDHFPIFYKGKETDINSPSEADVAAVCANVKYEEDDDDFGELEAVKILPFKLKLGGTKMVTKSFDALKGSVGKAALAAVTKEPLGKDVPSQGFTGKLMSLLAPNLGGFLASSMIGGKKKSPFTMVTREHINTIIIFVTNKLKKKEDRVQLRKAQVKTAVEVLTKTFLHFLILSVRLKKGFSSNAVVKSDNRIVEMIKVTVIDAVAANVVNFLVDLLMPDDDNVPQGFGGLMDSRARAGSTPFKQMPPPPPPPPKEYNSGELFDDDEDDYDDDEEE